MPDGRHLENRYDVITLQRIICILMKFGVPIKNHMPMAVKGSKSKPEVELQDGGRLFQKSEVVISWPWIEISGRNLVR